MNLKSIQDELQKTGLDGWLFFDHHQRDPLAYHVLGLDPAGHVSRRWYYFIPWTCFSIEPALYLPDFGVRTEINLFVEPRGARVTGEMQTEFVRL